MVSRFFIPVVLAMVLTAPVAQAQVTQLGGPANYPPAGFTGQQYVDNDGCVYLRAGFGGTVNWVPRVMANRQPLCDLSPTFGPAVAAAVAADMAPDPLALAPPVVMSATVAAPPVVAKPAAPIVVAAAPPAMMAPAQPRRSLFDQLFGKPYVGNPVPLVPMAPAVMAQPAVAQPTYQNTANGAQAQCVPGSPRLETVLLRSGGTALVCTKGDGTLSGWRSPMFPQGVIGGALTPQMMRGATLATAYTAPQTASNAIPTPPKGYRLAWKDDRLNPMRGLGTVAGQAQQDQVWTRDIPARLVTAAPAQAVSTSVSTMSAPASYVQVGTFGLPANAEGVNAQLIALGLPVSTSKITSKGRVLQVVYAGPFANLTQAQAALATTRGAGFADAILK